MTAHQLTARGWTAANLRERIAGCRAGIRDARRIGGPALWTYRFLFVRLYLGYRRDLRTLLSTDRATITDADRRAFAAIEKPAVSPALDR